MSTRDEWPFDWTCPVPATRYAHAPSPKPEAPPPAPPAEPPAAALPAGDPEQEQEPVARGLRSALARLKRPTSPGPTVATSSPRPPRSTR